MQFLLSYMHTMAYNAKDITEQCLLRLAHYQAPVAIEYLVI